MAVLFLPPILASSYIWHHCDNPRNAAIIASARYTLDHQKREADMATYMHTTTELGYALDDDVPIPYMQRTRDYYLALGYNNPYRWAHFAEVPFTPLTKPLAQARVALITTAAHYQPGVGDQGPGAPYNAAAKFYKVYSDSRSEEHT